MGASQAHGAKRTATRRLATLATRIDSSYWREPRRQVLGENLRWSDRVGPPIRKLTPAVGPGWGPARLLTGLLTKEAGTGVAPSEAAGRRT